MSNRRVTRVLNPGSGLLQRSGWAGAKVRVQLHRYLMARQAGERAGRKRTSTRPWDDPQVMKDDLRQAAKDIESSGEGVFE